MNRSKIETFAKGARTQLQNQIGSKIEQILSGSYTVAQIENADAVKKLNEQIAKKGQKKVAEECAYTWFNRLCALRFMDFHRYNPTLVVTPKENRTLPEILSDAMEGLIDESVGAIDKQKIIDLLSGRLTSLNPQAEIYKILLVSKCNALYKDLPYLFEPIKDYTDLLLPDDLLSSGSVLQKMLTALDDENCQDVEVIGWLYQYYISEKKDKVMKKKVITKDDMAAATQLFTPKWIVSYMVENSVGRLWLLNHPESKLKEKLQFYVEPAQKETDFVKITDPAEFRICDPCCGSGHELIYVFDILFEIYMEYGYPINDAAASIIQNNLYGIDLDERACQLAYFALMMKAREKDKRFLTRKIEPNICALESVEFADSDVRQAMDMFDKPSLFIMDLLRQFEHADEFGSLIVPTVTDISNLKERFIEKTENSLFDMELIGRIEKVIKFSEYLSPRYNIVITNPPYLGKFDEKMKDFAGKNFPDSKTDEFAMFMERDWQLCVKNGYSAMVNMQSWMFLSSYEKLRKKILSTKTILSMIHIGARGFDSIGGEVVSTTAFVSKSGYEKDYKGQYFRIVDDQNEADKTEKYLNALNNHNCGYYFETDSSNFSKIPGSPIAYWASEAICSIFECITGVIARLKPSQGLATGDNARYIRYWSEVSIANIKMNAGSSVEAVKSQKKWFPCSKGGECRKWFGNNNLVIDWFNDGENIKNQRGSVIRNESFYFSEGLTWSTLGNDFSMRVFPQGFIFESKGSKCHFNKGSENIINYSLGFFNSKVCGELLNFVSPTLDFHEGPLGKVPFIVSEKYQTEVEGIASLCVNIAKSDWDSFETSWDFQKHPFIQSGVTSVAAAYGNWEQECLSRFNQLKANEEELNRIFIDIYGLQDELTPEEDNSDVTVRKADLVRDVKSFISYAVGCMFGRYSLDVTGLAYAGGSWDSAKYSSFIPDSVNVIPVLDDEWFNDDIVARFKNFVRTVFGSESFNANIRFIENALGKSIRDYFNKDFYKDHLKTYQKRPIYWMYSSPDGNFKALVYLHRCDKHTPDVVLKYMREFRSKIQSQLEIAKREHSADEIKYSRIDKDLDNYDKILYSLALKQIELDLDDGVKVNYAKIGSALYPVDGLNVEKK